MWIVPVGFRHKHLLAAGATLRPWVPAGARAGDLILLYVGAPDKAVEGVGVVSHDARRDPDGHFSARVKLLAHLGDAVPLQAMKAERNLRSAGFIRAGVVRGMPAKEYRKQLYQLIVRRNASARAALRKYRPDLLP